MEKTPLPIGLVLLSAKSAPISAWKSSGSGARSPLLGPLPACWDCLASWFSWPTPCILIIYQHGKLPKLAKVESVLAAIRLLRNLVKAGAITSRLRSGRPDKTNSKEQQSMNAGLPNADYPAPGSADPNADRPTAVYRTPVGWVPVALRATSGEAASPNRST